MAANQMLAHTVQQWKPCQHAVLHVVVHVIGANSRMQVYERSQADAQAQGVCVVKYKEPTARLLANSNIPSSDACPVCKEIASNLLHVADKSLRGAAAGAGG